MHVAAQFSEVARGDKYGFEKRLASLPESAPSEKLQQQRLRFLESSVQEGRRQRLTVRAEGCCQIGG